MTDAEQLHRRGPTVSVTWSPHRPEDLARWLGSHQVFTTHSDHYATELMNRLGLAEQGGTLRIGVAHYNTASEVDLVLELLAGYRPSPIRHSSTAPPPVPGRSQPAASGPCA